MGKRWCPERTEGIYKAKRERSKQKDQPEQWSEAWVHRPIWAPARNRAQPARVWREGQGEGQEEGAAGESTLQILALVWSSASVCRWSAFSSLEMKHSETLLGLLQKAATLPQRTGRGQKFPCRTRKQQVSFCLSRPSPPVVRQSCPLLIVIMELWGVLALVCLPHRWLHVHPILHPTTWAPTQPQWPVGLSFLASILLVPQMFPAWNWTHHLPLAFPKTILTANVQWVPTICQALLLGHCTHTSLRYCLHPPSCSNLWLNRCLRPRNKQESINLEFSFYIRVLTTIRNQQ